MFCKLTGVECAAVGKGDPCPLRLPQPWRDCELQCAEDWEDELGDDADVAY